MADEDQAASKEEKSQVEESADVAAAASDVSKDISTKPGVIKLPVEGESKWISTMRLLGLGVIFSIIIMACAFKFLTGEDSFIESQQLAMITGGIVLILVFQYFFFLTIVIPRQADYAKYEIFQDRVEYYPLGFLGLAVSTRKKTISMSRFLAVMTGRKADKKGTFTYPVYLIHQDNKGKTIIVESFPDLKSAENFAATLGRMIGLKAVSGTHKTVPKRTEL